MLTLEELIDHRSELVDLRDSDRVNQTETEALETVTQMLSALIYQLENQSMSFTP
tara:strand:+ start:168 stop:332 length:165 start_codon:yes stop_codon:yes gene_type:complete